MQAPGVPACSKGPRVRASQSFSSSAALIGHVSNARFGQSPSVLSLRKAQVEDARGMSSGGFDKASRAMLNPSSIGARSSSEYGEPSNERTVHHVDA